MGIFNRRPKLPADRRPPLDRDERVLAWASVAEGNKATDGGKVVVATNYGLWLPDEQQRLGWHDIHKATWTGRELVVTPAELVEDRDDYRVLADRPFRTYLLPDPGEVPHHVRARVTRSVAYTAHHQLAGGGVRVAARRVSGVDGLTWTVRYDPGTAIDDETVVAQTAALVATARNAASTDD
ncbi:hypothetical protein ACWDV4_17760 [Micromonospora sp. NPDC003197]